MASHVFKHRYSFTPMMNPDYVKVAQAYDIPSQRVVERKDLKEAIQTMLQSQGPYLLEVAVIEEEMFYQ